MASIPSVISAKDSVAITSPRRGWKLNGYFVIGGIIVGVLVILSVFAPLLSNQSPDAVGLSTPLLPVGSPGHLLGTDLLGRDEWTRILYGGRTTLLAGVLSSLISAGLGIIFGMIAGYSRWWVDSIVMRSMDVLLSFPFILLAILIVAFAGASTLNALIAIAIANVPFFARLIRSEVLKIKELEFITASVTFAARTRHILFAHVLRMLIPYVISTIFLNIGFMISQTSALSFLGFGTQPPTAEWGAMLAESQSYLAIQPLVAIAPGAAIMLAVIGFNLLGVGIKRIISDRQQG